MSATAAAAGLVRAPGDPGLELNTTQDRDQWFNLDPARFTELCQNAYLDGDYSYVSVALRANHEGMKVFYHHTYRRDLALLYFDRAPACAGLGSVLGCVRACVCWDAGRGCDVWCVGWDVGVLGWAGRGMPSVT